MIPGYSRELTDEDLVNVGTPGHCDYGTTVIGSEYPRSLSWVIAKTEEISDNECKVIMPINRGPEKKRKGKVRKWS